MAVYGSEYDEIYGVIAQAYQGWPRSQALADFYEARGGNLGRLPEPYGSQFRGSTSDSGGGGGGGAPFTFDWEQAEKDALEKLKPYYEQILAETKGDVTLAKQRIEQDYQQGKRFREEDLATALGEVTALEPKERAETLETLNRRGLFVPTGFKSTIQEEEETLLTDKQQRRREAIKRALARKEEVAGIETGREIADIARGYPRYERELGEEKKEKAVAMAGMKFGREQAKWLAEASRFTS